MRPSTLTGLLVLLGATAATLLDDLSQEPPGEYGLTIDGKTTTVLPGRETTVTVDGKQLKITLHPPKTRVFDKRGIRFEYPSGMGFEYDDSTAGAKLWTLDGNDTVLMVQEYATLDRADLETMLRSALTGQYEQMNATVTESSTTLRPGEGGAPGPQGVLMEIHLGEVLLIQELYCFQGKHGGVAVILQDSRDEADEPTKEFAQVKRMVAKSLRIGR